MGTSYRFVCPHCGYHAEVSGGEDAGMTCLTVTITCMACRKLFDVMTRQLPRWGEDADWIEVETQCPCSAGHKCELWTHPGPCPKCGTIMDREDEPFLFWD